MNHHSQATANTQQKRVIIISQHFPPEKSGNASRIYDMAINLHRLGLDIIVISPPPTFPTGTFKRTLKPITSKKLDGIKNIRLWTWQPVSGDPGFLSRIFYYLLFPVNASFWVLKNANRFDVIITSTPPLFTGIPGLLSKKLLSKYWILDVRDLWIDAAISLGFIKKGSLYERISRKFERICCLDADFIGVTTNELGSRLSAKKDIRKKMILIPNGVDTDNFYPCLKAKKNQIIYAGNVGYAQDLEKVILAMKYVNETHDLNLSIVGDGDTKNQLKKLVISEKLEERVFFIDAIPREMIPQLLSESLIGLAPLKKMESLEYAVPTKAYEYMACGIPFLGCGAGEIVNLARLSGAGIIANNDPKEIAEAIIELIDDPNRIGRMGDNGLRYVRRNFDRKKIAMNLRKYIEILCQKSTLHPHD